MNNNFMRIGKTQCSNAASMTTLGATPNTFKINGVTYHFLDGHVFNIFDEVII